MLKIWDLSIRIYHWLQAVLFFGLAGSGFGLLPAGMHLWLGMTLLPLLLWRLGWGVFGSDTARFRQFVKSPGVVWKYVRGRGQAGIGHNPLGALMVVALLTLLCLQAVSGLLLSELVAGKALLGRGLLRWLADVHGLNALLLLVLAVLHILVILGYRLAGKNLIRPMMCGYAKISSPVTAVFVKQRWAVLWLLISVAVVVVAVRLMS